MALSISASSAGSARSESHTTTSRSSWVWRVSWRLRLGADGVEHGCGEFLARFDPLLAQIAGGNGGGGSHFGPQVHETHAAALVPIEMMIDDGHWVQGLLGHQMVGVAQAAIHENNTRFVIGSYRGHQLQGRHQQLDHVPVFGPHNRAAADQLDRPVEPLLNQGPHAPTRRDRIGIGIVVHDDCQPPIVGQNPQQLIGSAPCLR